MSEFIRAPILVVLGHVDVGKTTLLDRIRGTAVAKREPGTMTQHIGASFLPWYALEDMCKPLVASLKTEVRIPGFLVIDTPGHEAFSNLRRRGGSIADLAILVVDVSRGFEKQTYEALAILKARRTPFVVAANKIDRIPGWSSNPETPFVKSYRLQSQEAQARLEELLASIILELNRQGFSADRYDRIRDFTRTLAIVPISAVTGEGIADLMLVLAGLAQRYLADKLKSRAGPGKGVILELREQPGLGTTAVTIIYDGVVRRGDTVVVGGVERPIVTKVKALLMPKPLDEVRSPEDRFLQVEEARAAAGVLIIAQDLEEAVVGGPVIAVGPGENLSKIVEDVEREISSIKITRDIVGVVVKADTLGTLEALVEFLKANGIPVRYADIGPVVKRDVVEAAIVKQEDKYRAVILAFNVRVSEEARAEAEAGGIKIFEGNIIYRLVEEYLDWYNKMRELETLATLDKLVHPGVIQLLPGYVFRRSSPAIVGVKVLAGKIRRGYPLMNQDGRPIGEIMQIQDNKQPVNEATKGQEVAISIRGHIMIGRQVKEGEILYVDVPIDHANLILEKYPDSFSEEERELLKKIRALKLKAKYT